MTVEMDAIASLGMGSGLGEQDIRAVIACSEHQEFTKEFLKDIQSTKESVPKRTAHTQWSKF